VELENKQSWHMKASIVHQAESSRYNVTETQLGGMMTRHDLTINQVPPPFHALSTVYYSQ